MSLPDWTPTDLDAMEQEAIAGLGPGDCRRCGNPEYEHCSDCSACPDSHAGWCPSDPDNKARAQQNGAWF